MTKTYDIATIRYVGQLRFSICEVGDTRTCTIYAAAVDEIAGAGTAARLMAEHEALVEARRAPAPAKRSYNRHPGSSVSHSEYKRLASDIGGSYAATMAAQMRG